MKKYTRDLDILMTSHVYFETMILSNAKNIVIYSINTEGVNVKTMSCERVERIEIKDGNVSLHFDNESVSSSLEDTPRGHPPRVCPKLDEAILYEREDDDLNPIEDLLNVAKDIGLYGKIKGLLVSQIKHYLDVDLSNYMNQNETSDEDPIEKAMDSNVASDFFRLAKDLGLHNKFEEMILDSVKNISTSDYYTRKM